MRETNCTKSAISMCDPYLLVRRDKSEEKKTPGGIVIPRSQQKSDSNNWATVVTVDHHADLIINEGDRVLIGPYAGTPVIIDDEDLCVVRSDDVMGYVSNKNK